jgi:uncharacterized membrane protein YsdA (DUF1294 family)
MDNQLLFLLLFFLVINLAAFFVMFLDKVKSRKNGAERISEGMMFFLGSAFGSIGVWIGMFVFHHKTKKWYFILGIPLLMIQNITFLWLVYLYLGNKVI